MSIYVCSLSAVAQSPGFGKSRRDQLPSHFVNTPESAKPLAYWWWLNGHTDTATITSDLEAMKEHGYGGAILMDADGSGQNGNVRVAAGPTFGSSAWQALFLHALKEANRLGLEISLTIQSGWNVGGPSVTAAQSAKLLTWSRQIVHGPHNGVLKLDTPPQKNGFYRDIAVLAYPLHHGVALAGDATHGNDRKPIRDLRKKAVFIEDGGSLPDTWPLLGDYPSVHGEADIHLREVQDLTGELSPQGIINWNMPTGTWEIVRIGYTSSNAKVSTGSGNWQGLAIDYLDHKALDNYWNTNVQPLLTAAKPYLGKSLKYVYTDSWEVGGVNWTGRFREEFKANHGYDVVPYLPIVIGRIIEDRETTDRFLNDFRRTIANLVLNEHYKEFGRLAARNSLGFHPESGGPHGAPVDALETLGASTFPQSEFWAPSKIHRTTDGDRFFIKEASSAAHIYGKTLVLAEGMTSIGPQWEESPGIDLKPAFDQAVCAGLNRLVWHTFTSSPKNTGLPGQEYFAGTHFNPKVTWWRDGKSFIDYIRRVSYMMQQGTPVSDVLYYYGDHAPNFVQLKAADPAHVLPGYDYDVTDEQVLTTRLKVQGHRLVLPNGTSYAELVMPSVSNISYPALQAIGRLAKTGATIVGQKPTHLTGLPIGADTDKRILALADSIWGACDGTSITSRNVGTGKIICTPSSRRTLLDAGVKPDFTYMSTDAALSFDYVHRRFGTTDIYFVRNTRPQATWATLTFRVHGMAPEIWSAETGEIKKISIYSSKDEHTSMAMWFEPYGSRIIVFRHPAATHFVKLSRDGREVFPNEPNQNAFHVINSPTGWMLNSGKPGTYRFTSSTGQIYIARVVETQIHSVISPWVVNFSPGWGAPASVELQRLSSWTASKEAGIRYYSGTAAYTSSLDISAQEISSHHRITLDLGVVRETARVTLNDREVGVLWKAPFTIDITAYAKAGPNALRVEITNLWPNRIIGDLNLPSDQRFTKTNITKFTKDSPLIPSGLLGPVRIETTTLVPITPE